MPDSLIFESIDDSGRAGEIINRYIRTRRVEYPNDLADLLKEVSFELNTSVEACHRADFFLRDKGDSVKAAEVLGEVMAHITAFKGQMAFLVSQTDYCLQGAKNTRGAASFAHTPNTRSPILPPDEVAKCLDSLKADFAGWKLERKTGGWYLSVTTKHIEIEDPRYDVTVQFGQFEIALSLAELARGVHKPYRLKALQPNTGGSRAGTPHPHVQNNKLCEGAGETMLIKSIQVGDILSFMLVINQTLCTYNPESPYVSLEAWSKLLPQGPNPRPRAGFSTGDTSEDICSICEEEVNQSDMHACRQCGAQVCSDCSKYCSINDNRTICNNCLVNMRAEHVGCRDCSVYGRRGCAIGRSTACTHCGQRRAESEIQTCGNSHHVCTSCARALGSDDDPCCDEWASVSGCPVRQHMSRDGAVAATPAGFAAAGETLEAAPARRRGTPIAEGVRDDGIGGFGPPAPRA